MPLGRFKLGRQCVSPEKSADLLLSSYIDKPRLLEHFLGGECPGASSWTAFPCPDGAAPKPDTDPLGNDVAGCCVFAAPGHYAKLIGQLVGCPTPVTSGMVLTEYADASGYDPTTGSGDNGFVIRDMMDLWRQHGLYGVALDAYCKVDHKDQSETALALWLAGGLIGGYALPLESKSQVDEQGNPDWFMPAAGWPDGRGPGTWGGHCILRTGESPYGRDGNSWGLPAHMTKSWHDECCDELWMPVCSLWALRNGRTPSGFAYADLLNDAFLLSLKGEVSARGT